MIFFKKLKSIKQRQLFYKYEIYFKVLKLLFIYLYSNMFNFGNVKLRYFMKFFKEKNQIHNMCILTSKTSSLFRTFKISRHQVRGLSDICFLFGLKKAS